MNTSIKINNKDLPPLLERIGEAIREGKDLTLQESSHKNSRYVYTKIKEGEIKLLGKEGNESIKVEEPEDLSYSEEEIEMMERLHQCPESEDWIDAYHCNYLCENRENCSWGKRK